METHTDHRTTENNPANGETAAFSDASFSENAREAIRRERHAWVSMMRRTGAHFHVVPSRFPVVMVKPGPGARMEARPGAGTR